MSATATKLTAEQYYDLTVVGDRKQLVDGKIVVNDPKGIHAVLQWRFALAIGQWIEAGERRGLGMMPTDIRMDEHNVYGPDVLWFSEEHIPADLDVYPERVPDLCVEIRSESTWRHDIGAKKRVYEAGRLPELWLVDHRSETVLVYRRSAPATAPFDVALELARGETLASPLLPGFKLALETLFAR